jgi:catalase
VELNRRSVLLGIGAVTAFLAVDLGAVAYANKWIGPDNALTRESFLNAFRSVFGTHLGFRRNHAKGVVVTGHFDSNGNGSELSRAVIFRPGQTPVTGRFSLAGGNPNAADAAATARGLGLAFAFPDGTQWRSALLNLPVFPDNSAQGFYDRLLAGKVVPATGQPDPAAMAAFLAAHPESAAAMAVIKKHPPSPGFADSPFSSLITFYFVDDHGVRTPVRWSFVPQQQALAPRSGAPGDPTTDATLPWPSDRRTVDAGVLTLTGIQTEAAGNARDINFDPLVLPDGIEPSDDPLLNARSTVYAASYRARTGEPKSPSAVQVDKVAP